MNNIHLKTITTLAFLIISVQRPFSQQTWTNYVDSVSTLSSPRSIDLNNDGIKDIVVGSGTDSTFSNYGVLAFDGVNGNLLWNLPTTDEIFTSAIFNDINNDLIPDVFIGGRNAQLYAIDGSNGNVLWEYFPQSSGLNPSDSGLYNFYSSQLLDDQNGDNVLDILVTNGGDHQAGPFDPRPAGNLMVISGATGSLIAMASSPDSAEIYCSAVILDHGINSSPKIIFGTGGEQNGGSMFVTSLSDLLNNDISNALTLTSHPSKGFIAPASLADLTNDGFSDIVVQSFDGVIQAFDGLSLQSIWSNSFSGCESSSAPTIGNFTGGDLVPDIFNVVYKGTTPTYFDYYQFMINGATGEVVFLDSIGSMQFPSSSAFDANGDGRDEVLISINNITNYFSHQLKLIDFQNDTIVDITLNQAGVNLACSPLIDDLDQDGMVEFIYTSKKDSLNPSAWEGFNIFRLNTTFQYPKRGIAWGAYMGTNFDGNYHNLLGICPNTSLVSSWITNNPSCNHFTDGKIKIDQYNSYPSTFLWSDGTITDSLINAPKDIYTVYLTDTSNCLEIHNFQLNDPYYVSFGNIVHNNCIGDSTASATVSSSGCFCQFSTCTYNWSSGSLIKHATQLPAGYQTVILTHADGCVVTDSVLINDGFPVIDSFSINHLNCYNIYDGEISLFPSDSSSTIYNWSNGDTLSTIDHLNIGTYSVLVNNNYCNDSISFIVNSSDSVKVGYDFTNLNCFGDSSGSIDLFASGGFSPYLYHLNNSNSIDSSFNNLSSGTYQIFTEDEFNCFSDTIQVVLSQPDSLELTFNSVPETDSGYLDGSIESYVNGGTMPYTYSWSHSATINDFMIVYLSSGTYSLLVTDSNGCQISDSVFIGTFSSIEETEPLKFNLFPMPSKGKITITNSSSLTFDYLVFDVNGKIVESNKSITAYESKEIFLPVGNYILKAISENNVMNKKIVIVP
jgi:hypothetical protein